MNAVDVSAGRRRRFACVALLVAAPHASADDSSAAKQPLLSARGWQLTVGGYLQADLVAWSAESVDAVAPTTGAPLNEERFLIRRARLRVDARRGDLFGGVELDGNTMNGATARLLGATLGWQRRFGDLDISVAAGLQKTPFGVEVPASERDKPFLEPPAFARALVPGNYDAGIVVRGGYALARWSLGVVNGSPTADTKWRGVDPTSSFDFVGRVGAVIDGPRELRVELGVSGLTGTGLSPGTPQTPDTPGTPSATFDRHAAGADVSVHWGICMIGAGNAFAEGVLATNLDRGLIYADPIVANRDIRQAGFAVGAVQSITDYAAIGVRYDRYAADRNAGEQLASDRTFSTLSVMATGRWNDARLLVQYDHERADNADRVSARAHVAF